MNDSVEWLRAEYLRRRQRNPHYSLRAFARQLRLQAGPLSELLARKRPMTTKMGCRIAERLALSVVEKDRLLALIQNGQTEGPKPLYRLLPDDSFHVIADWYHYAILALTETTGFQSEPRWISKRLGISVTEVRSALDRLIRLGLLETFKENLRPTHYLSSAQDVPSRALRKHHQQILEKASVALEEVSVEERDVTCITFAVETSRLAEAKEKIKQFRKEMAALLNTGSADEVYHLSVQFIPATRKESK